MVLINHSYDNPRWLFCVDGVETGELTPGSEVHLIGCETFGAEEITVPDGVTTIGARVFIGNEALRRVKLPASLKTIGTGAFFGCAALEQIEMQPGLRRLGEGCFIGCGSLRTVDLPETVVSIRSGAFLGCASLKQVRLPEALRRNIEPSTFSGCINLERVNIPPQVQNVKRGAFSGCVKLAEVLFQNEGVSVASGAFNGCTALPAEVLEFIQTRIPDAGALNIRSTGSGVAGRLSNFTPRSFVFDGVECGSIEGVLQAFKCPDEARQAEICRLSGGAAKHAGDGSNWREDQTLYWRGEAYPRRSEAYKALLTRLYDAVYAQDEGFRADMQEIRGQRIDHTMGHSNPEVTVLTKEEFLGQLRRLSR